MVYIRNLVEKLCQELDIYDPASSARPLDKMTLEEFVKSEGGGKSAFAARTVATRAMLGKQNIGRAQYSLSDKSGLEPSQLSALFFMNYCKSGGGLMQMRSDKKDGGQYLRLVDGWSSSQFRSSISLNQVLQALNPSQNAWPTYYNLEHWY